MFSQLLFLILQAQPFFIFGSRTRYDMFAMVVNFINSFWEPTHVIVGVFEVKNIIVTSMANQVKILLNSFGLLDKIIAYVKDEGSNLNTLINALKSVVSYSPFQLPTPFMGSCFGYVMSKVAQYTINDVEVY